VNKLATKNKKITDTVYFPNFIFDVLNKPDLGTNIKTGSYKKPLP
jgi:hypothetical protein